MGKKEIKKQTSNMSNTLNTGNVSEKAEVFNQYGGVLKRISDSQDLNSKEVFEILKQEMELTSPTEEYNQCLQQVLKDHSKVLDGDLTFEEKKEILDRETKILSTATERENERIENNKNITEKAIEKDTEKSEFNWELVKNVSFVLIGVVAGAIGGVTFGKNLGKVK